MADVTIKYKDATIAEMSGSGTKTLTTGGKYCESNIVVEYEKAETEPTEPVEPEITNVKRWDITISSGAPTSGVYLDLLQDSWLAENRENPNLCVLVIPKFTIPYSSTVRNQGLYMGTNMPLLSDSTGALYYSLGAYVHTNASTITARARKYKLTNASDIGDIGITSTGKLQAIAKAANPLATGEYTVFAFIV